MMTTSNEVNSSKTVQQEDLPLDGESIQSITLFSAETTTKTTTGHSIPVQLEDLPVEGTPGTILELPHADDADCQTSHGPGSRHRRLCPMPPFIVFVALALMLILFVAVGVAAMSRNTMARSNEATIRSYVELHGWSSSDDFRDSESPQSRAIRFMAGMYTLPTVKDSKEEIKWLEQYALSVFYFAMNGMQWLGQTGFNNISVPDPCDWYIQVEFTAGGYLPLGASCDENDRIDALQLFSYNLRGSLPVELGLLTNLRYLILPGNFLTGSIPSELAKLTHIEIFTLKGATSLTGTIPDALEAWTNVQYFDCISCGLSGSIPQWINKWTALSSLGLTENLFTGTIPTTMSSLMALETLALDDNSLTGDLTVLDGLTNLRGIFVENNGFSQQIDDTFLQNLVKLEELDVSQNTFAGKVPVHLMGLTKMRVMDVNGNQLTEFPDTIPTTGSVLELLAVYNNPITAPTFPTSILNLQALTHLDVTSTQFQGDMPGFLGNLTTLSYLFLADTTFYPGPIPDEYQHLQKLTDLSLKDSRRTGTIPLWFEDLDNLILLDLDFNKLNSTIPDIFSDMLSLKYLLLNRNQLTGFIPKTMAQATNLHILLLDQNNVTGDLSSFCQSVTHLVGATANCDGVPVPQVSCACCEICCDPARPEETCDNQGRLAQYEPEPSSEYTRSGFEYDFLRDANITRSR